MDHYVKIFLFGNSIAFAIKKSRFLKMLIPQTLGIKSVIEFQLGDASRLLLNLVRIDQLTNDMSWRVGIPKHVQESKWVSSAQHKAKTLSMIRQGFKVTHKKRSRSRKPSQIDAWTYPLSILDFKTFHSFLHINISSISKSKSFIWMILSFKSANTRECDTYLINDIYSTFSFYLLTQKQE